MRPFDFFIFAGEQSGDTQGAMLLEGLLNQDPSLKGFGVLGPKMRQHFVEELLPMESFQVMGFLKVIQALPKIFTLFYKVKKAILNADPPLVILIDYPGFNLRLAKALRKAGYTGKIVQHVCPSIWAWKKNRVHTLEKYFDKVLCLFPFEVSCFAKASIKPLFIGHPLVQEIKHYSEHIPAENKVIALFPGSRFNEIKTNLPMQLEVALENTSDNERIVISSARDNLLPEIQSIVNRYNSSRVSIESSKENYTLMKKAKLALATSGTINLELALFKVPTVVTYHINSFDLFVARRLLNINLPHYCLVNYLASKRLYPEHYGPYFDKKLISKSFKNLYFNKLTSKPLELIETLLTTNTPQKLATDALFSLLRNKI